MDSCLEEGTHAVGRPEQGPLRPRASAPGGSEVLPAPVLRGPGPPGPAGCPGDAARHRRFSVLAGDRAVLQEVSGLPLDPDHHVAREAGNTLCGVSERAVPRGFLPSPTSAEPAELVSGSPCGAGALVVDEGPWHVPGSTRRAPLPGSWRPAGLRPHRVLTGARGAPPDLTPSRPHWLQ